MKKLSQKAQLVKFLSKNATLSADQALTKFGIQKLSARVRELRVSGVNIATTKNRKGETAYKLVKEAQA